MLVYFEIFKNLVHNLMLAKLVPLVNPDGYEFSRNEDRQLLKSSQERRLSIDQCKLIICCGVSIFTNNEY